jgi:RNA polymerase sigma-70 factor, ECF subfamily
MDGVGSGRDETVGELFEREFRPLVRSLSVAFDPESAADAVQEAFLAAARRWSRVSAYDEPATWVRRVAINRLINGKRNDRRRAEILATVRPAMIEGMNAELLDLRSALAALPETMKLTVCLHYLSGLRVADIAAALEVSEGTVKSNLHDGRVRLRLLLEEDING